MYNYIYLFSLDQLNQPMEKKSWDELVFDTVCVMIMTLLFPVPYKGCWCMNLAVNISAGLFPYFDFTLATTK